MKARTALFGTIGLAGVATTAFNLLVRGALTLDVGVGRRTRPLGPLEVQIAAPPETVFDVIAAPYLGKTPHAMAEKIRVIERSVDMVLAEHFTDVGKRRKAVTVETVRFERPSRVSFRLVRGPVPEVTETFDLRPSDGGTVFVYTGVLGTDFWGLGKRWGTVVAAKWEQAVRDSVDGIKAEAERLALHGGGRKR
jgi:uncharacterized protein YndB with AHSA1/START domain